MRCRSCQIAPAKRLYPNNVQSLSGATRFVVPTRSEPDKAGFWPYGQGVACGAPNNVSPPSAHWRTDQGPAIIGRCSSRLFEKRSHDRGQSQPTVESLPAEDFPITVKKVIASSFHSFQGIAPNSYVFERKGYQSLLRVAASEPVVPFTVVLSASAIIIHRPKFV